MIVLFTSPGCNASRKVKNILKDKEIDYIEKNVYKVLLNKNETVELIAIYKDHLNDLVCFNDSSIFKSNSIDDIYKYIINNPSMLNRPIIMEDEIDIDNKDYINELKKSIKCDRKCPHYEVCGALRK